MKRSRLAVLAVAAISSIFAWAAFLSRPERPGSGEDVESRVARLRPDYTNIVIPPNIAPLNFYIDEPGEGYFVRLQDPSGQSLEVSSRKGDVRFPYRRWWRLLEANRGRRLKLEIWARQQGRWKRFQPAWVEVASEEIDHYVVYRYLNPVHNMWDQLSIRQRNLASFEETVVIDNKTTYDPAGRTADSACINCHTFLNYEPDRMVFHMRPARSHQVPAMILVQAGRAQPVDTRLGNLPPAAYISWHPSGKLLVFSRNRLSQFFNTAGLETRDVIDRASDLGIYRLADGHVYTSPQISRPDRLETFPSWSPDGKYLYFCSAPAWAERPEAVLLYDKVRYDLERVSYDLDSDSWGPVEKILSGEELGMSLSLPSVSPDGRYLMLVGHQYGSFPVYQPSADLYLLDLTQVRPNQPASARKALRRLDEINSDRSDSYHAWSSSGRWVVFASKRADGFFSHLYFSHLGPDGRFSKPFLMPQQDPRHYDRCLMTYNRPEFLKRPVTVPGPELVRAMNAARAFQTPSQTESDTPWLPKR